MCLHLYSYMSHQLGTLGQLSLLLLVYLLACFYLWKKIWFDPFGGKSSLGLVCT